MQSDPVFDTTHLQNFLRIPDNLMIPIFVDVINGTIKTKVLEYMQATPQELKPRTVAPHPITNEERMAHHLLWKYLNDLAG